MLSLGAPATEAGCLPQSRLCRVHSPTRAPALRRAALPGDGGSGGDAEPIVVAMGRRAACLALTACMACGSVVGPASAVLNSPVATQARSADAALRRSIPAFNESVKEVQSKLENVATLLRIPQRKPWASMTTSVASAKSIVSRADEVLEGVPPSMRAEGETLRKDLEESLGRLLAVIEQHDPSRVSLWTAECLRLTSDLELLQAPGLPFAVPTEYKSRPLLTGRALVELTVRRAPGAEPFVVDNVSGGRDEATVTITVDGFSAPVSAGAFVDAAASGRYTNQKINAASPNLFIGDGSGPTVPLEILPQGSFEPMYRLPLEVGSGETPVLPLSIYGSVALARPAGSSDISSVSSGSFFIYLFDPQQAGLAGLSFDEGLYGTLGYVTDGQEVLRQIREGDTITAVKVVQGLDRLVNRSGASA